MNITRIIRELITKMGMRERLSPGFTLAELLVSIAIFSAITTLAVLNNNRFNSSVILTNLAYEIALSVRQAQFYGITVKGTSSNPNKFNSGYGVRFDLSSPATYALYEDVSTNPLAATPDHIKTVADADLEVFTINKGNKISKICLDGCPTGGASILDITFVRPNPEAFIRAGNNPAVEYGKAEICLVSPDMTKRKIIVERTGQISVASNTSPACD